MPDDADRTVSDDTRATEQEDEEQRGGADREPTANEAAAADALPPVSDEVAEHYEHQAEIGADVKGEGQIG